MWWALGGFGEGEVKVEVVRTGRVGLGWGIGRILRKQMQGEVYGISLPSYTSVLETAVTARSQQSASFAEHRAAAMSSFSSRCDFLQYEGLSGSLSAGKPTSRLRHPMAKIGDEAGESWFYFTMTLLDSFTFMFFRSLTLLLWIFSIG